MAAMVRIFFSYAEGRVGAGFNWRFMCSGQPKLGLVMLDSRPGRKKPLPRHRIISKEKHFDFYLSKLSLSII